MSAREESAAGRIRALLEADPVCQGNVTGTTVTAIAREWCAQEAEPDSDVLAERAACLTVLRSTHGRLAGLLATMGTPEDEDWADEPLATEVRRLAAAIEAAEQGLHRSKEN